MNKINLEGMLAVIYMNGGHIIHCSLQELDNEMIKAKTIDGQSVIIFINDIVAMKYLIKKDNQLERETKKEDLLQKDDDVEERVSPSLGDIETLIQLRKMKKEQEIQEVRKRILSRTGIAEPIEYGSNITALKFIKRN